MKMLCGYVLPSSGSAQVCGIDVVEYPREVKRKIGYLPEHNPLYLDMYVKEYLHFVAGLSGMKTNISKKVKEMIDLTGLGVEQNKLIGQLSKGYRQRIGLAQALIHDPEVLILDEPTSGLDPNQITEIRKVIKTVGEKRTVILSTHIMQEVEAMCDRVIIINQGKIVADDRLDALRQKNLNAQCIQVKFKNSVSIQALKAIKGVQKVEQLADNHMRVIADTNIDLQEHLFNFAVETKNILLEQKQEEQQLEHVFRAITGAKDV
jgi:ABC-2 type transport system ATP-binding protein